MDERETFAALVLHFAPGVGIAGARRLHEHFGSLAAALEHPDELPRVQGLTDEARASLADPSLRERALAENAFWHIMVSVNREVKRLKYIPDEFEGLDAALADIYYANFSVFQSLPDSWAIKQVFPIMPIHRLTERPTCNGIISDITCDCDGKIDKFVDLHDERRTLPLHPVSDDDEYYLGAFLVGAYQETLGDLHNLLGDTNVVNINISRETGHFEIVKEIEGDTVADVLSYVEYSPKDLINSFRSIAERAIEEKKITPAERRTIVNAYENGLRGYTYFER